MYSMTRLQALCLIGLALTTGCATAVGQLFTGAFYGSGRQCHGTLIVRDDAIEWRTPFANCGRTSYRIINQSLTGSRPKMVLLLKKNPVCSFAVITLDKDPAHPEYWNATGYRTRDDYRKESDDSLRCSLTKEPT
jgi:hypothetical protein